MTFHFFWFIYTGFIAVIALCSDTLGYLLSSRFTPLILLFGCGSHSAVLMKASVPTTNITVYLKVGQEKGKTILCFGLKSNC